MRLIGCMSVRNEDWVLGLSARVALQWCDALVILNHASTDRTPEICLDLLETEDPLRVMLLRRTDPTWDEMAMRQEMLVAARSLCATHIAIVDADEIMTANVVPDIRGHIEVMPPGSIMQVPLFNLRHGLHRYHANGIWGNRWLSLAFVDEPRLGWQGDQFHHREPFGRPLTPLRPFGHQQGGVMHLWGSDEKRLKAKHALYKVTERMRWPRRCCCQIDKQYNMWRDFPGSGWRFDAVPPEWWGARDLLSPIRLTDIPWQEAEVRRLVAEHGAERFAELDLFGIV